MRKKILTMIFIMGLFFLSACYTKHDVAVSVAPVEVKPIHITIDVNVKIDRELDDFFGDLDKAAEKL